ncbi:unnamed protein product [Soboliphyme baturini]|uniref:TMEM131_like domain-containing protein n=1 Tax=Soboliphyme baturini TaxID=241478 RepID=A0A183J1S5_9BILA|nr:unnamed protein product [Soboliphyme baturini]
MRWSCWLMHNVWLRLQIKAWFPLLLIRITDGSRFFLGLHIRTDGLLACGGIILILFHKCRFWFTCLAVPVTSNLVWPHLLQQQVVNFPVTALGNFTILNLTLQNPSNQLLAVQIIPLTIYPNPEELLNLVSPLTGYVEMDDVLMFSLRDSELYNTKPESPVPAMRRELEKLVGIPVPRFTLSFLLKPAMKVSVRVGFLPSDYHMRSSLLLIRNNLTGLEAVPIYGRGGKMELRVGSRMPQSNQPLLFEIQEKHLRECENKKRTFRKLLIFLFSLISVFEFRFAKPFANWHSIMEQRYINHLL